MFTIDTWRTISLGVVSLGQTLFVILYTTFPWYRTFLGRALFYKALTLCVIVDMFMLNRVWTIPHADAVFVVLYMVLGTGVWFQFFVFLHVVRTRQRVDWSRGDNDG